MVHCPKIHKILNIGRPSFDQIDKKSCVQKGVQLNILLSTTRQVQDGSNSDALFSVLVQYNQGGEMWLIAQQQNDYRST